MRLIAIIILRGVTWQGIIHEIQFMIVLCHPGSDFAGHHDNRMGVCGHSSQNRVTLIGSRVFTW